MSLTIVMPPMLWVPRMPLGLHVFVPLAVLMAHLGF
jgi:hypothetical protein